MILEEALATGLESSWVFEEFSEIDFQDKRLNRRLIKLGDSFSCHPLLPINQACEDWADTKAAYNFFNNSKVGAEAILGVHQTRTQQRMKQHCHLLAIQDTTYLDYTQHPKKTGLGPIGTKDQNSRGLLMHTTLVMTPAGLPLGLLDQQIWARDEESNCSSGQVDCSVSRKATPIEEKESYKFLKALEQTVALTPSGVKVITVCDRESDVYEFMIKAEQLDTAFVIRAAQDRKLEDESMRKLWDFMINQAVVGCLRVEVSAQKEQKGREAHVQVRVGKVKLSPPQRIGDAHHIKLKPIEIHVIWVKEPHAPDGVEPLEWMLLTNETLYGFEDALACIDSYSKRWGIEVYHKVLKSGCKVEDCRFEDTKRLIPYLTLFSIIAWRMYWMTLINRHNPEAPCTMILADHEWKALYCKIHRTNQLPEQIPKVNQTVQWIAKLGGFLARKNDKQPGVTTIWRGYNRLSDIADTWKILYPN